MRFLVLSVILLLAACSPQAWNDKLSTPKERATAERVIALLRARDVNGLKAMSDAQLAPQLTPESLRPIAAMTPSAGAPSLQTVAVKTMAVGGAARTMKALNYEMGNGKSWAMIQVVLDTSGDPIRVDGFRVFPADRQPSTINDFTLTGKPVLAYVWLAMMVLAVAVTILGAATAFRSPRFRKLRWLWVIGSLFSFGTFSLNWTTGAFGMMPISFLLLGAGALRAGPLSPWVVSFAIPVVAIVILVLNRRTNDQADDGAEEPAVSAAA